MDKIERNIILNELFQKIKDYRAKRKHNRSYKASRSAGTKAMYGELIHMKKKNQKKFLAAQGKGDRHAPEVIMRKHRGQGANDRINKAAHDAYDKESKKFKILG